MALGAFVAGLLLAETEFRKAIETTIEPFKGLLLGVFFFTVGMNIDFRELAREPFWLLACGGRPDRHQGRRSSSAWRACSACRWPRRSRRACCWVRAASSPSSSSAWRRRYGLVDAGRRQLHAGRDVAHHGADPAARHRGAAARHRDWSDAQGARRRSCRGAAAPASKGRAIVVGHGRVGQIVCDMLERHRFPFIATDRDPAAVDRVSPARARGLLRRCRQPGVPQELRR